MAEMPDDIKQFAICAAMITRKKWLATPKKVSKTCRNFF